MKFRKKPVVIEATQWFKHGDHRAVRYYKAAIASAFCKVCGTAMNEMQDHGWIETLEGGYRVCPGDWIITGVQGEQYPCKPDIFEATYDLVSG